MRHIICGKTKEKREETLTVLWHIIKVKQEAIIMESTGKRKQWKNQLKTTMEKNARVLAFGIRVAGPTTSNTKKQKVRADLSHLTVQLEGLNNSECQKWWQETPDIEVIKQILIRAQLH